MSKETKNMELFQKFSDQIRLDYLDEQFKKASESFKKLENDTDISSEALFYAYFLAGYQSGITNIHRFVSGEAEFLDRMISLDEALGAEA